jgi:exopolyphosphatase/guanosine-5'-triphosphate,3'-diphosphate pyrophosphatase
VRAVATSAVRDAANGAQFVKQVQRETGIVLATIDGNIEAALTIKGIKAGLDQQAEQMLMFDVGGGSTEYGFTCGDSPLFSTSLPLGVVRLASCSADFATISDKIDQQLSILKQQMEDKNLLPDPAKTTLVGTAGTATSLAAIDLEMTDYDYRLVNNHQLSRQRIDEIYRQLAPLSPLERLKVTGLEPGREDLIIAGILITLKTMDMFGFKQMKVSDYGLLEGLLFV